MGIKLLDSSMCGLGRLRDKKAVQGAWDVFSFLWNELFFGAELAKCYKCVFPPSAAPLPGPFRALDLLEFSELPLLWRFSAVMIQSASTLTMRTGSKTVLCRRCCPVSFLQGRICVHTRI